MMSVCFSVAGAPCEGARVATTPPSSLALLLHDLLIALILGGLGLAEDAADLQDFGFVILRAVHATLELLRVQVAAALRDAAGLQMQSNFLRALRHLLDLLPPDEQFALGLDEFGAAAQPGAGLLEDAVAPGSAKVVVAEIREDQHHGHDGKD